MSIAIPIPMLQHLPDVNVTPAVGVDGYALTYDNASGEFVLVANGGARWLARSGNVVSPFAIAGCKLILNADDLNGADASSVANWYDTSGNAFVAVQASESLQPKLRTTKGPNGRQCVEFDGADDYLGIAATVISRTQTAWTVVIVIRNDDYSHNGTFFDVTEQTDTQSVIVRLIDISATLSIQVIVRDEALNSNIATYPTDVSSWCIITAQRNADAVTIRENGVLRSTVSAASIGAMDGGLFFTTIGAVHNALGLANFLEGCIYAIGVWDTALSATDLAGIEAWYSYLTNIPLGNGVRRVQMTPVIALGKSGGGGDASRLLEPTVLKSAGVWHMWYCGNDTNGGGSNQDWKVFHTTSNDGINWAASTMVLTEAWEPSVILVGSVFYMAYVTDAAYNVRIASSSDGLTWTDHGEIVTGALATWSAEAPREPNLFYDAATTTFYCYFGAQATADSKYKIGVATCASGPTTPANWAVQTTPMFAPTIPVSGWNQGGDTESPCVRYYASLPHPYLMSFIGYNNEGQITNKPWRAGFAYSNSPLGPWTEFPTNPVLSVGESSAFDSRIVAEMTHVEHDGLLYCYFSGGTNTGQNQIGLAIAPMDQIARMMS